MLQLVYISTARGPVDRALIDSILTASRRNNARVGVTGLLVSGGRRFLQALEGPEAAVRATYARIKADPRHLGLVQLSARQVDARAFGDWEMAHQVGSDAVPAGGLEPAIAALVAPLQDKLLQAQFTGFAALHAKAA